MEDQYSENTSSLAYKHFYATKFQTPQWTVSHVLFFFRSPAESTEQDGTRISPLIPPRLFCLHFPDITCHLSSHLQQSTKLNVNW